VDWWASESAAGAVLADADECTRRRSARPPWWSRDN